MKSLNKIMVVLSVAFAAIAANAADSYLYWMAATDVDGASGWTKAMVNYGGTANGSGIDGGTWLNPYYDGDPFPVNYLNYAGVTGAASAWGVIPDGSLGSSFIFELLNEDGLVGYISKSWDEMVAAGAIATSGSGTPTGGYYTLTSVVPEPTSGLLSLFGLAALALRRRRRA